MEESKYLIQLDSDELRNVTGGNQPAYNLGYEMGNFVGGVVKNLIDLFL
ncbi:MAG: hypothetical protein ACK5HZ_06040 [Macellibacteroides fermentans]